MCFSFKRWGESRDTRQSKACFCNRPGNCSPSFPLLCCLSPLLFALFLHVCCSWHYMADFSPSSRRSSASVSPPGEVQVVEGSHAVLEKHQVHHGIEENECQYITFETEIPVFSTRTLRDGSILNPPNLRQFQSPFQWSSTRKNVILFISCGVTMLAGYTAGSYSMAAEQLQSKWGLSNVSFNTGVTTWAVGFACSPMMLAPLSEINGRRPVFIGSGVLLLVALVGSALTESFAGMLIARFFVGAGASTFATMVGGVVSDISRRRSKYTDGDILRVCFSWNRTGTVLQWLHYREGLMAVGVLYTDHLCGYHSCRDHFILQRNPRKCPPKQESPGAEQLL